MDAKSRPGATSANVGRHVMKAAAVQGMHELREASLRHAQRRAATLQLSQSSSLATCAEDVHERDYAKRKRREIDQIIQGSRSSSFETCGTANEGRNERLELVEDLRHGPYTFDAPSDDPQFERIEPHSSTKIKSRYISHAAIHQYMDCRYAITPSVLYSLTGRYGSSSAHSDYARDPTQNFMDGNYELPLYGDWVLFAVMGEKSALKYTHAKEQSEGRAARKYFSCKLLDLSTKHVDAHHQLPGYCVMNMLVFEASEPASYGSSQSLVGGSGGAFEKLWKERDGVLLAILNPRIMRMLKGSGELSITPRSADSILVIGLADHYGQCEALRKDGTRCRAFVMKGKNHAVCEMHLEKAISSRQRSRMEFASSASSYMGKAPNIQPPMTGLRPGKRAYAAANHAGLDVGPTSMNGPTYATPPSRIPPSANEPSSSAYDVSANFGRAREEKEQRKRRRSEQAKLTSQLKVQGYSPKERPVHKAHESISPPEPETSFLAYVDQSSTAAQALRTAQATLRGGTSKETRRNQTNSEASLGNGALSRLLARHSASMESLPQAQLHGAKFHSNVLDRDSPAARHMQVLKMTDRQKHDLDDDLIIVDSDSK